MATLPFVSSKDVGIYQVCTAANTDYAITVPDGAIGAVLWFETSASNATLLGGRVGVDAANTTVTGITGTDKKLAYHPAMPVQYELPNTYRFVGRTQERNALYLHVACATALAVVRGMWLYGSDS